MEAAIRKIWSRARLTVPSRSWTQRQPSAAHRPQLSLAVRLLRRYLSSPVEEGPAFRAHDFLGQLLENRVTGAAQQRNIARLSHSSAATPAPGKLSRASNTRRSCRSYGGCAHSLDRPAHRLHRARKKVNPAVLTFRIACIQWFIQSFPGHFERDAMKTCPLCPQPETCHFFFCCLPRCWLSRSRSSAWSSFP